MSQISIFLVTGNIAFSLAIWFVLDKERKRNRILQAFIAGLVRSVSDYVSVTDRALLDEMPAHNMNLPIPYGKVLEAVEYELLKNVRGMPVEKHERWLLRSRRIFQGETARNNVVDDGFVFLNYDLFDSLIACWRSDDLMSPKEIAYLSEEIKVTSVNVAELRGEIAMYKDLLVGRLSAESLRSPETIDNRLAIMFSHLKPEYLDKLKEKILADT